MKTYRIYLQFKSCLKCFQAFPILAANLTTRILAEVTLSTFTIEAKILITTSNQPSTNAPRTTILLS